MICKIAGTLVGIIVGIKGIISIMVCIIHATVDMTVAIMI